MYNVAEVFMAERKIFNYDSVILADKTLEIEGYDPDFFGRTSPKFIWATCRFCGNPSRIRKGQFNKSGSACHKECRLKEQSITGSPFKNPEVKAKSKKTNLERYGSEHANQNKEVAKRISKGRKAAQSKTEQTNLQKYGVINPFQSEEIKLKIKETNMQNLGVEHPLQSEIIKNKIKQTCIGKFGTENPMQNDEVKEKAKETNIKKYQTPYATQNESVKQKTVETNMQKYGVSYPAQSNEIKNKIQQTNLEKFGSLSPFGNEEVRQKAKESTLEHYGVENPFASPVIREQIEMTFFQKYGVRFPSQVPEIREKIKQSCIDTFGVDNPAKDPSIKEKTGISFQECIKKNINGNFDHVNALRTQEFWDKMAEGLSLKELAEHFDLRYQTLSSSVHDKEFRNLYQSTYTFPKHQIQNEVKKSIQTFYNYPILNNTRKVISPLELDLYFPDDKFAIEFNGSMWHSEAWLTPNEAQKKHYVKTIKCRDIGIRLFHVFQNQWADKKDQILNFIRTILGRNQIQIDARKCTINNDKVNDFLNYNHIQGYSKRTIKFFNLVHNNEIVASMTASPHHRQTGNNEIVLNRLCFLNNCNVRGGSTRLFSYFKKWAEEEGYSSIISWSDNCWTEGNIYGVLGFQLNREYMPDYFYWDSKTNKYVSKQSQRKSSTNCPENLTEREWCIQRNLYRIWDCGKKKWVYEIVKDGV